MMNHQEAREMEMLNVKMRPLRRWLKEPILLNSLEGDAGTSEKSTADPT